MTMTRLRVHIAPLGFEADRITLPLKQTKADRLWLISHDNLTEDKSGPYREKIKKECKKLGVELKTAHADRLNLFKMIKMTKSIIEGEKDNYIYVNVASGSKIQSIACMMACMVLDNNNIQPFYAEPEKYAVFEGKQQSYGMKKMIPLPRYELQTPKPKLLAALKIISEQKDQKISKKEMARIADEQGIISVNADESNYSQARFTSLDKNIIAPLEKDWKFVEVEKIGRTRWIKITEEGRNAAEFLI